MRPRAAEDPMQNTWSIGRTWKPREGWSRPVLMVERQPTSTRPRGCVAQDPAGPREGAQGARSSHAHDQSTATASIVRSPNRHTPAGNPRFPADNPRFAAAMAQERRPVPFRTRKLRPSTAMVLHSRGCGRVARRRILLEGVPVERHAPGTPIFFYPLAFWSAGLRAFPAGGSFWPLKVPVRRQISGMLRDLLALIRWLNRLKNYALFRTQTLCRIEQNHVSRQSNSSAGR